MKYISLFVGWFLQHFTSSEVSMIQMVGTLAVSTVNAIYIYYVYRVLGRKTIYSKHVGITVSSTAIIVTAIIFAVHSSVVLSLGVVGALSIVRFRTAFKEALDIIFLFWAVTTGVCYGGHMGSLAVILSAFLTVLIFYLDAKSIKRRCRLLILESEAVDFKEIEGILTKFSKSYVVKTRNDEKKSQRSVVELMTTKEYEIIKELKNMTGIREVSILEQNGEHCF